MKLNRLLLLSCSCVLFSATKLIAQPIPLLTSDKLWSTLEECNVYAGFPDQIIYKLSYWMKTGQDTIVNGKTYLSILYATDENHSE